MKKVLWLVVLIAVWVYGSGYWAFTDANVNRFLNEWEGATARGDADAICKTLADGMTFSMHDDSTATPFDMEGNKEDFCAYVKKSVPMMAKIMSSSQVTREEFKVERKGLLHWWTAEVSYTELRTTGIARTLNVKTISEDKLILTKTFSGVLVKRLESESYMDDGT